MTSTGIEAADIGQRLRALLDYVRDCQTRVARDEVIDLDGLDNNVIELCDAIASLPQEDGLRFEDDMQALIDNLEVLMQSMQERQETLDDEDA